MMQSVQLADVCKFIRGITFKPSDRLKADAPQALACFRTKNVQEKIDLDDLIYIPRELASPHQFVQSGDILISTANSREIVGKCCFVEKLTFEATLGGFIAGARADVSRILPRFLYYWMSSPAIQTIFRGLARQTTNIANLPLSHVAKIEIPLPPLDEQRRIVRILDEAEALQQLRARADERMADFIPALFNQMFGDPATNPMGFKLLTLGEACQKITDGVHLTPTYVDEGVPFLRVTDIQSAEIDWASVKRIPRDEYVTITRRTKPERGDILYSKNGTIGIAKEITWDEEFAHFVSLALLKPDRALLDSTYLTEFLNTPMALRQAMEHSKTGTVTNLHLNEIRKIKVPCPPPSLQREFVARVAEVRALQDQQEQSRSRLEAGFQALLHRAFAGSCE